MLEIEYNVPPTIQLKKADWIKNHKAYDELFYFVHSDAKKMILEVNTSGFCEHICNTHCNKYTHLRFYKIDDSHVMVVKKHGLS